MEKRIFLFLFSALLYCGCARVGQSNAEKSQAPELEQEDSSQQVVRCSQEDIQVLYQASGDKIVRSVQTIQMSLDSFELDENIQAEDIMTAVKEQISVLYDGLDGVTAQARMEGSSISLTIEIDYQKADLQALIQNGFLEEGEIDNRYVSLKKTIAGFSPNACTYLD